MLPLLIGAGMGLAGTIGGMLSRGKANREMNALMGQNPAYEANPLAAQRLAMAQTLLNARMPGAARAEQNIYQNQANTVSGYQRNATDGSQLLQMGSLAQGQTNDALENLEEREANDYQRRYQNLVGAEEGSINEGDKVFQDKVRQFQDKVQLKGAQAANRSANWQSLANFGFGLADYGMSGGFDKKKKDGSGGHNYLPIN